MADTIKNCANCEHHDYCYSNNIQNIFGRNESLEDNMKHWREECLLNDKHLYRRTKHGGMD
jgi:hypothetical protein